MCPEARKNLQCWRSFFPWKPTDGTLTMKAHDSQIHDAASMTLSRCELDPVHTRVHVVLLLPSPLE